MQAQIIGRKKPRLFAYPQLLEWFGMSAGVFEFAEPNTLDRTSLALGGRCEISRGYGRARVT